MALTLNVAASRGYSADQIAMDGMTVTLADLLAEITEAIETYGEDAMVVTYDEDNRFGASFGHVRLHQLFSNSDDEDEV